ncbi:MAG: hypothetical protein HUK09_06910 [Bacteroidaceae bacterium]|nr:hypothetical protein [Bacteroidaceae bacterium]
MMRLISSLLLLLGAMPIFAERKIRSEIATDFSWHSKIVPLNFSYGLSYPLSDRWRVGVKLGENVTLDGTTPAHTYYTNMTLGGNVAYKLVQMNHFGAYAVANVSTTLLDKPHRFTSYDAGLRCHVSGADAAPYFYLGARFTDARTALIKDQLNFVIGFGYSFSLF